MVYIDQGFGTYQSKQSAPAEAVPSMGDPQLQQRIVAPVLEVPNEGSNGTMPMGVSISMVVIEIPVESVSRVRGEETCDSDFGVRSRQGIDVLAMVMAGLEGGAPVLIFSFRPCCKNCPAVDKQLIDCLWGSIVSPSLGQVLLCHPCCWLAWQLSTSRPSRSPRQRGKRHNNDGTFINLEAT